MGCLKRGADEPARGRKREEETFLKAAKKNWSRRRSEEGLKCRIMLQSGDVSRGLEYYIMGKKITLLVLHFDAVCLWMVPALACVCACVCVYQPSMRGSVPCQVPYPIW